MTKSEDSGSPGWGAAFFLQTTEDVAKAVAAAATAATTARSPRPSAVFSIKDDSSQLQKLQRQFTRVLQGSPPPTEVKRAAYNPEVLTSLKRQWARFQLHAMDHRSVKEPSRLFESMVVLGLHPNTDIQTLQQQIFGRRSEGSGKWRSALGGQNQARVEPNIEPQVLFAYPPGKQLPLKSKDLLSFCFPGGLEVHAVERTPSMSELNEILLGQEHLKKSDQSFVFRLQVADDSTLYGCCMLVEETVQKPSGLISVIAERERFHSTLTRHILTTRRCYCILTRLPFFELHFGVLKSIFTEERLERLTQGIDMLELTLPEEYIEEEDLREKADCNSSTHDYAEEMLDEQIEASGISGEGSSSERYDDGSHHEHQMIDEQFCFPREQDGSNVVALKKLEVKVHTTKEESGATIHISGVHDGSTDEFTTKKQAAEKNLPQAIMPLLVFHNDSSDSSTSFQDSPSGNQSFRSDVDEGEAGEPSTSGREDFTDHNILKWAKENNHGSMQIVCEYYRLCCPTRGTTLKFSPLDHLPPLEFHRPGETVLHVAGLTIDLTSCSTSLEFVEAHNAILAEEEAGALSIWTIACLCGFLRLEHVLTMLAAALLEKQIVVVCTNLGILSASVLSVIPLIRPYHWQSLLMPVLPNDMLEFLDAPVPYIVGVKTKTGEVQSKLSNVTQVDANKNQVRSPSMPQLPQYKELFKSLSPYHAKLVGESYLGKRRPVFECTEVQIDAAKGFLAVLRSYLDSLCSNLRSHTITNVQSNDDKVSLLLKESFIDSFPNRDRPFMKLFVDTQLFSVHTDLVLSFYQKD
ncbi:DENN (AEX-3) domain-containing protein [Thalictrum thalictroides]|uniref:DENN (AEX-3) domain-containing protein n=1 Tax=Thalictrum thalictroides TaxID=46969 RepID=A0A7J6V2J1_THATH|nr:DENN (AEX-3) domain-containing protein [Thalictrum thalictroides]